MVCVYIHIYISSLSTLLSEDIFHLLTIVLSAAMTIECIDLFKWIVLHLMSRSQTVGFSAHMVLYS